MRRFISQSMTKTLVTQLLALIEGSLQYWMNNENKVLSKENSLFIYLNLFHCSPGT